MAPILLGNLDTVISRYNGLGDISHLNSSQSKYTVISGKNIQTPWPLVSKRTVPTQRPPLVD
jgi:hypothetical protein